MPIYVGGEPWTERCAFCPSLCPAKRSQVRLRRICKARPHLVNWYPPTCLYNHGIQIDGQRDNLYVFSAEQTKRSRRKLFATISQHSTLNTQHSKLNTNKKGLPEQPLFVIHQALLNPQMFLFLPQHSPCHLKALQRAVFLCGYSLKPLNSYMHRL